MKKEEFVEAICTILTNNGVISHTEAHALKTSFKNRSQVAFDDFLLEEGLVEKEDLLEALSQYYNVPYMDPVGYFFDHYLLKKFPKDFLLRNLVIPIEAVEDAILIVAANNPADEDLLPQFGRYVSYDIEFRVSIASEIVESIEEYYDKSLTDLDLDSNLVPETAEEIEKEALKELHESSEEE